MRHYQARSLNSPAGVPLRFTADDQQQRAKRIYWENLAFHAADFNQKAKKV
jgi:hypothetical protein